MPFQGNLLLFIALFDGHANGAGGLGDAILALPLAPATYAMPLPATRYDFGHCLRRVVKGIVRVIKERSIMAIINHESKLEFSCQQALRLYAAE